MSYVPIEVPANLADQWPDLREFADQQIDVSPTKGEHDLQLANNGGSESNSELCKSIICTRGSAKVQVVCRHLKDEKKYLILMYRITRRREASREDESLARDISAILIANGARPFDPWN